MHPHATCSTTPPHADLLTCLSACPCALQLCGLLAVVLGAMLLATKLVWKTVPVFSKKDLKKLEEHRVITKSIMAEEHDLYQKYFDTLSHAER